MPSRHQVVPYDGQYGPHLTLRSSKSVPSLAIHPSHHLDNGGPGCPVHGGTYSVVHGPVYHPEMMPPRPRTAAAGSIINTRTLVPHHYIHHGPTPAYSVVNFPSDKKSYPMALPLPSAPMSVMKAATLYRQPLALPPPAIIAMNGAAGTLPTKIALQHPYYEDNTCCKGHLIVLWIILGVVTLGVISGIVLGVTMN